MYLVNNSKKAVLNMFVSVYADTGTVCKLNTTA